MKKICPIFISLFLFLVFGLYFTPKASATILFQDDFESGSSKWTPIKGPNLWQIKNGEYGALINSQSTILVSAAGSISVPNYIVEFDMHVLQGEDKNVEFRWRNNQGNSTGVHFTGGNALFYAHSVNASIPYVLQNNHTYHIKAILNGQNIKFYIDGGLLFDKDDPSYQFIGNEQVVLVITTGSTAPTEVYFDNVVISSISDDINLNVPLFMQTDPLWGNNIYDSADRWSPASPGIKNYGCAMTSVAMIFRYYGINKLPDDTTLDPGTLNTWLKNQPDGYVGDGLVNWLAFSRLSKNTLHQNPQFSFDALEVKIAGSSTSDLKEDLKNGIPNVLQEPGHFIVGYGTDGSDFLIRDPYYANRDHLVAYGGTFSSRVRYVPSHTDLSYILLTIDPSLTLVVKDSNGNSVGQTIVQEPITDQVNGGTKGSPLKMFYLEQPQDGIYTIEITGQQNKFYTLGSYFYDVNGEVMKNVLSGVVGINKEPLKIHFDKSSSQNSTIQKIVTLQTMLDDLEELNNLKKISNKGIYTALKILIQNAQKHEKNKQALKGDVKAIEELLKAARGKGISEDAYQILMADLLAIKSS